MEETHNDDGLSRREFVTVVIAASAAGTIVRSDSSTALEAAPAAAITSAEVVFTVNRKPVRLSVDPRVTLLDALRERLNLTGSKKGCDHGQCGACTVLLDGRRANACLVLAVAAQRHAITTIEGLAPQGVLHPLQRAFVEHDGFQCGFCTP